MPPVRSRRRSIAASRSSLVLVLAAAGDHGGAGDGRRRTAAALIALLAAQLIAGLAMVQGSLPLGLALLHNLLAACFSPRSSLLV